MSGQGTACCMGFAYDVANKSANWMIAYDAVYRLRDDIGLIGGNVCSVLANLHKSRLEFQKK